MQEASKELHDFYGKPHDQVIDVGVSIGGIWAKRGCGSQFGVVAAIARNTGKILDVELMSKFCEKCKTYKAKLTKEEFDEWFEMHKSECSINFFKKVWGLWKKKQL